MGAGKIIVGPDGSGSPSRDGRVDPKTAWVAAGIFSLIFLAIGVVDLGLALAQSRLGDEATRFGVLGAAAGGLPLLGLGTVGLQVAAIGGERRSLARLASGLGLLLALGCLAGMGLLLAAREAAFAGARVASLPMLTHILVRSLSSYLLFAVLFIAAAWSGWRAFPSDR